MTKPILPPPVQALLTAIGIWFITKYLPEFNIRFAGQKNIGICMVLIGLSIDLSCIFKFISAKTTINPLSPSKTSSLVINGIYRYSRNPMYLGLLLLLGGQALWLGNPFAILAIAAFITSITLTQIKPEEKALEEKFGQEFLQYKRNVRRWI